MTVNSSANSVILILFAFTDILSAENSKLSAESGLCRLSLLGSMMISSRISNWQAWDLANKNQTRTRRPLICHWSYLVLGVESYLDLGSYQTVNVSPQTQHSLLGARIASREQQMRF